MCKAKSAELEVWFRTLKEEWKYKLKKQSKKIERVQTILGKHRNFLIIIYNCHHYKHIIAIFISYF